MKRRINKYLLCFLSLIVVFCTTYLLILPAIALSNNNLSGGIQLNYVNDDTDAKTKNNEELTDIENVDTTSESSFLDFDVDEASSESPEGKGILDEQASLNADDDSTVKEKSETDMISVSEMEPDNTNDKAGTDEKGEKSVTDNFIFNTTFNDSIIYVEAPVGAFAEGTQMFVKEAEVSNSVVQQIENKYVDEGRKVESIKALDITFVCNNQEVQPDLPVKVSISSSFIEDKNKDDTLLVHVDSNDNTDLIQTVNAGQDLLDTIVERNIEKIEEDNNLIEATENNTIVFETDSFSTYAVVYTVDFYYGDYEYHLEGGKEIYLHELFNALGIDTDINDVTDVKFSNTDLVKVYKVEGNYVLESVKPFNTTETLTITTVDGEITVKVTDAQSFTINICTYDYDGSTLKSPDSDYPINGDYFVRAAIQKRDGVDAENNPQWANCGWWASPVGSITNNTVSFSITDFAQLGQAYDSQNNRTPYDSNTYRVDISSIRLFKATQNNWRNNYNEAINPYYTDDSAPDKYNYFAGVSTENGYQVNLKRAKDIDYYVRLKFEGATQLADVMSFDDKAGSLYALVSVGHKNSQNTYGFVKIADSMKKQLSDGSIVIDVPINVWLNGNGESTSEVYTGHETSISVRLVGIPTDVTNPLPSAYDNNDNVNTIRIGDFVNNFSVIKYPTTQASPDRIKEDSSTKEHTENVYDVITLSKDNRVFEGYNLEYILEDYNLVTLCPNGQGTHYGGSSSSTNGQESADPNNGVYTDGDVFLVTHAMGAVLIRGDLIMAGGSGVADSVLIEKPSVVGGKVLDSSKGTPGNYEVYVGQAVNTRSTTSTDPKYLPDFYIGEDNSVYGVVINGKLMANPRMNANGKTLSSDSYIDWDILQASMISSSETLYGDSTKIINITPDNREITIPAGSNVTLQYSDPSIQVNLHLTGDLNSETGATIINIATNNVTLPIVQTINNESAAQYLNSHNVEGGSKKEDGAGISLLFNAPNVSKIVVPSTDIIGHVLAPRADVRLVGGNYNGCIIGNSIYTASEGHRWPYNGPKGSIVPTNEDFEALKYVNNEVPTSNQIYTFILEEYKDGAWQSIERKQNDLSFINFSKITYNVSDIGTHYYQIYEDSSSVTDGKTADTTKYIVKVVVSSQTESDTTKIIHTTTKYKVIGNDPVSGSGTGTLDENKVAVLLENERISFNNTSSENGSLKVIKSIQPNNITLTDEQKQKITFEVKDSNGVVIENGNFSLSDMTLNETTGAYEKEFSNLLVGTYTVSESIPDDSLPNGYTLKETTYQVSKGTTAQSKALPLIEANQMAVVTITNVYEETKTGFCFRKVWLKEDTNLNDINVNDQMNWPEGNAIEISIRRIDPDNSQDDFVLSYSIGFGTGPFKPSNISSEGDKVKYQLVKTVDGKVNCFTLDDVLDAKNSNGNDYVYYVVETSTTGALYQIYYGQIVEGKIVRRQDYQHAKNDEIIINLENIGYELPNTGETGIWTYIVLGGLISLGTGILLLNKRMQ